MRYHNRKAWRSPELSLNNFALLSQSGNQNVAQLNPTQSRCCNASRNRYEVAWTCKKKGLHWSSSSARDLSGNHARMSDANPRVILTYIYPRLPGRFQIKTITQRKSSNQQLLYHVVLCIQSNYSNFHLPSQPKTPEPHTSRCVSHSPLAA